MAVALPEPIPAQPVSPNKPWAELIQLIPIVSFALPLIVSGHVELSHAGTSLLVAALLTVPVTALVLTKKQVLNPILIGTGAWLWVSAAAFALPSPALIGLLVQARAFGLFVAIALTGLLTTLWSPQGFIGCRHEQRRWLRDASSILLCGAGIALIYTGCVTDDIRLGGGVPFILLNVLRRVLIGRAPGAARR